MAQVSYNSLKKYQQYGQEVTDADKVLVETVRDRIFRHLLLRQSSKDTSRKKDFIKAGSDKVIPEGLHGISTCDSFKKLVDATEKRQLLHSLGLSDSEVSLLFKCLSDENLTLSSFNEDKLTELESRLKEIQEKLPDEGSESFGDAVPLTRHEYEEEMLLEASSKVSSKCLSSLVKLKPYERFHYHQDHPINHLKDIEESLFPKPKHQQHVRDNSEHESLFLYTSKKPESFWDMDKIPKLCPNPTKVVKPENTEVKRTILVYPQNEEKKSLRIKSRNDSQPFVLTLNDSELVPVDTILASKVPDASLQEICKGHYAPGIPSRILYLKNLPKKLSRHQLASLFGNFELKTGPKLEYRILAGRMRGTAFVKFPDVQMAKKALQICSGYLLYDKPIVIEYGKALML